MQNDWNLERINIFKAEITKMLLAFNKPLQKNLIEQKADLLNTTLNTLKTEKITEFFEFARASEETMPSDGSLRKLLSQNYQKFTDSIGLIENKERAYMTLEEKQYLRDVGAMHSGFTDLFDEALADNRLYPSADWAKRFWARMQGKDMVRGF